MERLTNWETTIDIEMIENISGAQQYYEVIFLTKDNERYKFILRDVWDIRCSIENASIERFCEFRKYLPEGLIDNGVYVVEDSEYIKYFEHQVSGTRPMEEIKHYLISDQIDMMIDVLTPEKPVLVKM